MRAWSAVPKFPTSRPASGGSVGGGEMVVVVAPWSYRAQPPSSWTWFILPNLLEKIRLKKVQNCSPWASRSVSETEP